MSFFIGSIPIHGQAILAPMDGISDHPFRAICRAMGSAMTFSEFINARHVLGRGGFVRQKAFFSPAERPVALQIYGEDVDEMVRAALKLRALNPDLIDINLGCPDKSIVRRGAGVGLMRHPLKIARLFRRLSAALDIPVTGKIRLGWDDCLNYQLIGRVIEENGGQAVTLHARSKEQKYSGRADWEAIAALKQKLAIPVIGNGDIRRVEDIAAMRQQTGCDAVMIGRAAIGNPWLFAGVARESLPKETIAETIRRHLQRSLDFYGEKIGLLLFRKHAVRYIPPFHPPRALRTRLLRAESTAEFLHHLDNILQNSPNIPLAPLSYPPL